MGKQVTILDIIKSAESFDEGDRTSGAFVTVNLNEIKAGQYTVTESHTTNRAKVHIIRLGEYINLELEFPSDKDTEFLQFWKTMDRFGVKATEAEINRPALSIVILPVEYEGEYYIMPINPVFWTLQPSEPGAPINSIRLCFKEVDFDFYVAENVDMENLRLEALSEENAAKYKTENIADSEKEKRELQSKYNNNEVFHFPGQK